MGAWRGPQAFTLIELMVAMGISTVVMAAMISFFLFSNRSFASLTNHVFMEQQNQFAMDILSQQIRQVKRLTAYSSESLTFQDYDSSTLQFVYDQSAQTLSRIKSGVTNVLLSSCSSLQFQIYSDNVQSNAFDVTSAVTNAAQCKVVLLSWTCTQTLLGRTNSEPLQCAKIFIRNTNGS